MLPQRRPGQLSGALLHAGLYPSSALELRDHAVQLQKQKLAAVTVLNSVCADVGLPALSEHVMGVREVTSMVQLTLHILAEPYSKHLCPPTDKEGEARSPLLIEH